MPKYRKISVDVDAFQISRDVYKDPDKWPAWLLDRYQHDIWHEGVSGDAFFFDSVASGRVYVRPGDWVVREFDGVLRLMHAEEFASTYVEVKGE